MRTLLFVLAVGVAGAFWALARREAAGLQVQIAALRLDNSERDALLRERERLQQEAARRIERQRDAGERARREHGAAATQNAAPQRQPEALVVGEWRAPASWTNRGQSTPSAAIETTLWAAAGGDLTTLESLLHLDEAVRAKAEALLRQLPKSARAAYASPEHLIAAFTTKSIPIGEAQLVWNHQPNGEEAFACVFVKDPDANRAPVPAPAGAAARGPNEPPAGSGSASTRSAYLSLRRSEGGWQLVVPVSAIEKIEKEIGALK